MSIYILYESTDIIIFQFELKRVNKGSPALTDVGDEICHCFLYRVERGYVYKAIDKRGKMVLIIHDLWGDSHIQ